MLLGRQHTISLFRYISSALGSWICLGSSSPGVHVFASSTTGDQFYNILAFEDTTTRFSNGGSTFYVTFYALIFYFKTEQGLHGSMKIGLF